MMPDGDLGIAEGSVNINDGTGKVNDGKGAEFAVPDIYADKGWAKGLTSFDDLWKLTDGGQELIGKKALPDASATPEQWDEHYKSIGKPDEAGKYTFNRDNFSKEFQEAQNDEYDNAIKGIFHKAGLQQRQVDIIQPEVEKLAIAIAEGKVKTDAEAQELANKAFDTVADKAFGANRDQILADTKVLLKEHVPKGFEEKIANLDDENLVILSGVLNSIKEKYINEDGSGAGEGGNAGADTVEDLKLKARTIMQSEEYRNSFNSNSESKRKEVRDLFEKIATMQS